MKKAETIMEILAAYDLTHSFRDAAELVGCAPNTVARYVRGRDAGELRATPVQRTQLVDAFREKIEEWVDASHGRVRADVAQRKLEAMGYMGSERTTRRAIVEAKATYRDGHRRRFRPWLPEPGLWFLCGSPHKNHHVESAIMWTPFRPRPRAYWTRHRSALIQST